ncbi:MAG TPA: hypothetical protein VK929_09505 [Longimicrobiales bacterium]|nr:hypothetical protein [Longimicrobiales bacterium]
MMAPAYIEFPLRLQPVVRSREGGDHGGVSVPYHPVVWIVDNQGRHVADIGTHADDIRGGRIVQDPHQLVARASRFVVWLHALDAQLSSLVEALTESPQVLVQRTILVNTQRSTAEIGVQFCSIRHEEFDHITQEIPLLGAESAVEVLLDAFRDRVLRRHDAAVSLLARIQEAVDSWRTTEELAASRTGAIVIDDGALEH